MTESNIIGITLTILPYFYAFFSYYLARFKDSFRQDTIDVMLGNPVSAESLLAMDGQQLVEEDATEATEHARQLVEDCRRMLLGLTELPMGSWGLINADPECVLFNVFHHFFALKLFIVNVSFQYG